MQVREEAERSQMWCQVQAAHRAPGWERSGVDGRSRKSHSQHKQGSWGMPHHPSAWPCKTQKWRRWLLGTTEHCTNTRESFGRLLRRLQGLEQRRSVSTSMSVSMVSLQIAPVAGLRAGERRRLSASSTHCLALLGRDALPRWQPLQHEPCSHPVALGKLE